MFDREYTLNSFINNDHENNNFNKLQKKYGRKFNILTNNLNHAQNKLDKYYDDTIIKVKYTRIVYSFNPFKKHKFIVAKFLNIESINLNWIKLYEILIQYQLAQNNISFFSDEKEPVYYLANKHNLNIQYKENDVDLYIYNFGITNYDSVNKEEDYYDEFVKYIDDMESKLKIGGTFIIKCYTIICEKTIKLLAYLTYNFDNVYLYKPYSSNPANSETYVICKNYFPCKNTNINNIYYTKQWIKSLYKSQSQLIQYQVNNILLEISGYEKYKNQNRCIPFNFGNNRNRELINGFDLIIGKIE